MRSLRLPCTYRELERPHSWHPPPSQSAQRQPARRARPHCHVCVRASPSDYLPGAGPRRRRAAHVSSTRRSCSILATPARAFCRCHRQRPSCGGGCCRAGRGASRLLAEAPTALPRAAAAAGQASAARAHPPHRHGPAVPQGVPANPGGGRPGHGRNLPCSQARGVPVGPRRRAGGTTDRHGSRRKWPLRTAWHHGCTPPFGAGRGQLSSGAGCSGCRGGRLEQPPQPRRQLQQQWKWRQRRRRRPHEQLWQRDGQRR